MSPSCSRRVLRVAIADDHPVLREGLLALLNEEDDLSIVADVDTAESALQCVSSVAPDVLVMDLSMPGDVMGVISQIAAKKFPTKVVVYTAYCGIDAALKTLDAGALAFVLKTSPYEELVQAIQQVAAGQQFICRLYASEVFAALRRRSEDKAFFETASLNPREAQIVAHLLRGRTNQEIADELGVSVKTVKYYMTSLMNKLQVRNRLEVVIAARRLPDVGDLLLDASPDRHSPSEHAALPQ